VPDKISSIAVSRFALSLTHADRRPRSIGNESTCYCASVPNVAGPMSTKKYSRKTKRCLLRWRTSTWAIVGDSCATEAVRERLQAAPFRRGLTFGVVANTDQPRDRDGFTTPWHASRRSIQPNRVPTSRLSAFPRFNGCFGAAVMTAVGVRRLITAHTLSGRSILRKADVRRCESAFLPDISTDG
jgi:hypothetical protein